MRLGGTRRLQRGAVEQLEKIGANVVQRKGMHQKIAIMDDKITWEGSLNILSHRDTQDQMRRIDGAHAVQEIVRNLELDKKEVPENKTGKICPKCQEKGIESTMVVRKSIYGSFWGCVRYPECRYTENISKSKIGK